VFLTGAWAQWKAKESPVGVQAFFLFDDPKTDSIRYQNRYTTGLYSNGTFGGFDYEVDGAYQFGQHIQNGESPHRNPIAASLIGVRAGYTFTDLAGFRFGVGYDRLSGNDPKDPDTYGAFNTLYGTNHKFYGFMDYATNIPLHTKGMGLQDMMVNLSVAPSASVKLTADGHLLALASDPADLTPAPAVPEKTIGQELDLSATYTVSKNLSLSACYCVFDGDRNRLVATGQRKTTQWGFVSVGVGF
jgi:hypothetical protein